METIIDGITYDSPYPQAKFLKRQSDGKVIMYGIKVGDVIGFGDGNTQNNGKVLSMTPKYIEIDDGSGLEVHCRLQYNSISQNRIYATFQKLQ